MGVLFVILLLGCLFGLLFKHHPFMGFLIFLVLVISHMHPAILLLPTGWVAYRLINHFYLKRKTRHGLRRLPHSRP